MKRLLLPASLATLLVAPPAQARDHGDPRPPETITTIVVHSVSGPFCADGKVRFTLAPKRPDDARFWREKMRAAPVEAHFVIGRDGTIEAVMPIDQIAYHTKGINPVSIGIELVNDGDGSDSFPPVQIASLEDLIRRLRHDHPAIRLENILGHSDIDQRTCECAGVPYRRRQDPGANFPMDKVRKAVRLPTDGDGPTNLPRLTGAAPEEACHH